MKKPPVFRDISAVISMFIILLIFSWLVDLGVKYSGADEFSKVNAVETQKIDPDIMVFGSSVGEKGCNSNVLTGKTGLRTYNACIDGTIFQQTKGLIERYNSYSRKKSIVLFFETFFSLERLSAISSIERWAAYLRDEDIYSSLHTMDSGLVWKCRFIPLYKNTVVDHTYYKASLSGWKNLLSGKTYVDSLNGFLPNYSGWMVDQDAALAALRPAGTPIDAQMVRDYVATINALQQTGKKVAIVLPPCYVKLFDKIDFTRLRSTLDSVSAVTKCAFFDFTHSRLCDNKSYFYNSTHLNYGGAVRFSEELGDSILAHFR